MSKEVYEELELIGGGSFGVLRKVRRKSDGKILAWKEIDYRRMEEKEKRQLVAEVNILRELKHPHIVRYIERHVDRENCLIYIIMEYCEGGDLASIIKRCKQSRKHIPEEVVWNLFSQLLLALNECHHPKSTKSRPVILHRDIKPENILLDKDQNAKLGDFGLARTIEDPEKTFAKTFVGTPYYQSPELASESSYNAKSDVWALGCVIFELCALEPPFLAKSQLSLTAKIQSGHVPDIPSKYSRELNSMIKFMLQIDQAIRPSISDILSTPRLKLVLKERELNAIHEELKRKESSLAEKEAELSRREESLRQREDALRLRQSSVTAPSSATRFGVAAHSAPKFSHRMSIQASGSSKTAIPRKALGERGLNRKPISHSLPTASPRQTTSMILSTPFVACKIPSSAKSYLHSDGSFDNSVLSTPCRTGKQIRSPCTRGGAVAVLSPFSERKHLFAIPRVGNSYPGLRNASRQVPPTSNVALRKVDKEHSDEENENPAHVGRPALASDAMSFLESGGLVNCHHHVSSLDGSSTANLLVSPLVDRFMQMNVSP